MTTFLHYTIPRSWTLGWLLAAAVTHTALFLTLNLHTLYALLPVTVTPLAIIGSMGAALFLAALAGQIGIHQGPATYVAMTVFILLLTGLFLLNIRSDMLPNIGIIGILAGGGGLGALLFWIMVRPDLHPLRPIRPQTPARSRAA